MQTLAIRAELLIWIGLSAIGLGLSVLLVYAWVEVMNNPGHSLVDGYWIGRVPWTPLGIVLVLAGSTVAVAGAAVAIGIRGDWLRRLLATVVVLVPAAWWAMAFGVIPLARYRALDPVTLAYSLPETAALMLILPALAMAVLRLAPIRPGPVRLRPVHPDE
jgi:hypothetical protein